MSSDRSLGFLVHGMARLLRQLADRRLHDLGLSSAHLPVITALKDVPQLSQKDLAIFAGVEQPTMANTLTRMQREGIVERRPDPEDGRISLFSLSNRVLQQVPTIEAIIKGIDADTTYSLTEDEGTAFHLALQSVSLTLNRLLNDK